MTQHYTVCIALQEEIKQQILIKPDTHYRGYQQLGANVTRYEEGYQRDWHEAIDLYREQSPNVSKHSVCLYMRPTFLCMQTFLKSLIVTETW